MENHDEEKEDPDEGAGDLYLDKNQYFLCCFVCF